MIEVVANHGRLAEGRTVPVVIADIEHAFLCRVCPDLLIQLRPIGTAFFRIDLPVQLVQLRVVLMDPVEDALFVIPAQVQILQPYSIGSVMPGKIGEMKQVDWIPAS